MLKTENSRGCGILNILPAVVTGGTQAKFEFYPSNQVQETKTNSLIKKFQNNVWTDVDSRMYATDESTWRHVLMFENVTHADSGDYHVDCGEHVGTTNTVCLRVAGNASQMLT